MFTSALRLLVPSLFAAALLLAGGCASAPKARIFNVKVTLDPALAGSSLQVDLIGANPISDLPKYESYSVSDYWKPGDSLRHDATKAVLAFGQGRPMTQTLSSTDPIWKKWIATGAMHLVVLVDLPGIPADRAGNADPRRLILPLDGAQWKSKTDSLEILVQESGARLMTAKKP
jgi:hypothetical protein